jgi:dehydrogenase/reductase SDR family protein 7B
LGFWAAAFMQLAACSRKRDERFFSTKTRKGRTMMSMQRSFFFVSILLTATQAFYFQRSVQQQRPQSTTKLRERAETRNLENYENMLQCNDVTKKTFEGKSVLLTGASGGLGKELALQFAECHVHNLVLSGRNQDALQVLAQECQQICPSIKTHVVTCDLSDRNSVQSLGQQALALCDTIDVLVNNGGVSSRSDFVDTKLDVDERVMQINFFAGASLAKAVVPNMLTNGSGKIIWISSVQGLIGIPQRTSYAASKFAVQGYAESLRAELASSGVGVHVISPGYIRTNLSKSAITGDGTAHGKMDETTAKGKPPKEVAVSLLDSVSKGQSDVIVAATASAKIAIWLRFLFPSMLQKILVSRYEKSKKVEEERPKTD